MKKRYHRLRIQLLEKIALSADRLNGWISALLIGRDLVARYRRVMRGFEEADASLLDAMDRRLLELPSCVTLTTLSNMRWRVAQMVRDQKEPVSQLRRRLIGRALTNWRPR